ncbi:CheY-like chemotaxis protein [Deinobacterium chartae]|uniref:CheY-like chemotaxis protein n=1 Tax=Deinobacterium chartae TaxID=521158 RepID=A0A841I0E5_9DEIO|nr:response regulator [Deinobacterium chartae]MBB6097728.1 CheY-like chemotaxis protein [Deinobacterium chartae]
MLKTSKPVTLLVADDNADDRVLMQEALAESQVFHQVRFVEDGEQLMDYLYRRGAYQDPERAPYPSLILLDLNMPRKDGREALREIKADPRLCVIPVVVLTTSKAETDISSTYSLGVNSFITKPATFDALLELLQTLGHYWFETVELPSPSGEYL